MLISFDSHSNSVRIIPSLTDKNTWDHRGQVFEFTDLSHPFHLPGPGRHGLCPSGLMGGMVKPGGGAGSLGGLLVPALLG